MNTDTTPSSGITKRRFLKRSGQAILTVSVLDAMAPLVFAGEHDADCGVKHYFTGVTPDTKCTPQNPPDAGCNQQSGFFNPTTNPDGTCTPNGTANGVGAGQAGVDSSCGSIKQITSSVILYNPDNDCPTKNAKTGQPHATGDDTKAPLILPPGGGGPF